MRETKVIIDEQALISVSDCISNYIKCFKEAVIEGIEKLKPNNDDWNDEDFNDLLSAISSFMVDVEEIETVTNQLVVRIKNKINAIHELRNMKI